MTFSELGIAPKILETLNKLGYTDPTPIQAKTIPSGIEGKDMMGIAQTGTGKTLAFGIPMLQRLAGVRGQGLVVLPTRELAIQVDEVFRKIGPGLGIRSAVLIGGTGIGPQISALRNKPQIIIATPGRLLDHMEQRHVRLDEVKILVLDEADRMLDMGFAPQLNKIMNAIPRDRQTMLFSATMPPEITAIATRFMKLPLRIEVAPAGTTSAKVTQEIFIVGRHDKERLLEKLLTEHRGTTLVFTRTKWGTKKLARAVKTMGHSSVEMHGNRSLGQRREALDGFKTGRYRVLVATDIAARGIDVVGISLVINYDLPMDAGDYVHRIGRTARAGAGGHAISFATPEERRDLRDIERLIKKTLPISQLPTLPPARFSPQMARPERGPRRGPRHYGQR